MRTTIQGLPPDDERWWFRVDAFRAAPEEAKAGLSRGQDSISDPPLGGGGDKPKDVVPAENGERWFTVYGLIDPRDQNIFYVGVSTDLDHRIAQHHNDAASSAWRRCQDLKAVGKKAGLCVFGAFRHKVWAKLLERRLVRSLPGLENSDNPKGLISEVLYPPAVE